MRGSWIVAVLILFLISLATTSQSVQGYGYLRAEKAGPGGGASFVLENDGHVRMNFSGDCRFDVYFMTQENYEKMQDNLTFAYIQELSRFNVTYLDIESDLPAGEYTYRIVFLEAGMVKFEGPPEGLYITYPSSTMIIPWEMIAAIAITAVITASVTYAFINWRKIRQ